jgi:hypothetical protein
MVGVDIGKLVADLGDEHMARALLGFQLGDHARLPAFGSPPREFSRALLWSSLTL